MFSPEVETRAWDEQLRLDDAAYREQLAYLFERSRFYRSKLGAAGIAAVLLDLGFPPASAKAVPLLARTASLLAHLTE